MSRDANFHMERTALTVGRFTHPSVAKSFIEVPQGIEESLVQRFLWIFPKPTYAKFASLEPASNDFCNHLDELKEIVYIFALKICAYGILIKIMNPYCKIYFSIAFLK